MNASIPQPEPNLTPDEIVDRARAMVPVLRERSAETEQLRTLPQQTVQDCVDAGFYRILQPRRFGGYEFGLRTFCDVMKHLSRGCTSTGWVLTLTSAHTFHLGAFPEAGQEEIYGEDGDFRSPLIFAPQGTATPADGGYRLTGRWNYNSGGEHANWLAVNAAVPGDSPEGPPEDFLMTWIRREDYEIFDNWNVVGMRGTGPKQAIVNDVFVPQHRTISQPGWFAGDAPGYGVHEDPFYRTPPLEVFCAEVGCVCIGLGEAAIDAYYDRVMTKQNPFPPFDLLREERSAQRRLGYARARVDAASAIHDYIVNHQAEYAVQAAEGTLEFSAERRRRILMLTQQIARNIGEAVDLLFDASGTSAVQSGQLMERLYRDLATIRTHYFFDVDRCAENWGATFLGLEAYSTY
jgi:3-hydroxy-9,10-secoandrosta-1,3,5(10)-triene-9,17-dione monooxygenase